MVLLMNYVLGYLETENMVYLICKLDTTKHFLIKKKNNNFISKLFMSLLFFKIKMTSDIKKTGLVKYVC